MPHLKKLNSAQVTHESGIIALKQTEDGKPLEMTTMNQTIVRMTDLNQQTNLIHEAKKIQSTIILIFERIVWNLYRICGLLDTIQMTNQKEHQQTIHFPVNLDTVRSSTYAYLNQIRSGPLKTLLLRHHLKNDTTTKSYRKFVVTKPQSTKELFEEDGRMGKGVSQEKNNQFTSIHPKEDKKAIFLNVFPGCN